MSIRVDKEAEVDERTETHVEHAIGLVEDEEGGAQQVGGLDLDHVDHAAGRGHDDLGALLQVLALLPFGAAAVAAHHVQAVGPAKLARL